MPAAQGSDAGFMIDPASVLPVGCDVRAKSKSGLKIEGCVVRGACLCGILFLA